MNNEIDNTIYMLSNAVSFRNHTALSAGQGQWFITRRRKNFGFISTAIEAATHSSSEVSETGVCYNIVPA